MSDHKLPPTKPLLEGGIYTKGSSGRTGGGTIQRGTPAHKTALEKAAAKKKTSAKKVESDK